MKLVKSLLVFGVGVYVGKVLQYLYLLRIKDHYSKIDHKPLEEMSFDDIDFLKESDEFLDGIVPVEYCEHVVNDLKIDEEEAATKNELKESEVESEKATKEAE